MMNKFRKGLCYKGSIIIGTIIFLLQLFSFSAYGAEQEILVSFENDYVKVGEALTINVSKEDDIEVEWYVDGVKIANSSKSYIPTIQDLEKWIEVVVTSGEKKASAKIYCSKLPVVYIETEYGAEINSKEEYINGTLRIQGNETDNTDTTALYDGKIEIRGRGNSTWYQPKKPYKIKLDKKTDVFGMGKNKHWVLLANFLDDGLMRNTLSYDFSGSLGMEHMSTVWVDVILNGEYVGNYQFCEQVRVDETRVDIFDWEGFAEDAGEIIAEAEHLDVDTLSEYMLENMEWITSGKVVFQGNTYLISNYSDIEVPSIDGGYLLELDEYYDEISKFRTESNQPIMFKSPEYLSTNVEMMNYVQTYVQTFEDAIHSQSYTAMYEGEEVHYSDLYEFDSLVDYWIVSELFLNEEFNKKSTYMYKEIGEPMKMGPIWDMDLSSGANGSDTLMTDQWATLSFSSYEQADQWYKYLVKDPHFLMRVQDRYWKIRDVQIQDMLDSVNLHYEYLKESGKADTERWEGQSFFRTSFDDNVAKLNKWLLDRVSWIDEQMEAEQTLTSWFYDANSNLKLTLSDKNGNNIPSQSLLEKKEDILLTISGEKISGRMAHIFVNSRKVATVDWDETSLDVNISADEYVAYAGDKNTIEVKVFDGQGTEIAKNYITFKVETGDVEEPVDPEEPVEKKFFTDVYENDFYYDAVYWATKANITDGWTTDLFAPNMLCTRGQVVTFLYRLAGEPEVSTLQNPFTDVIPGAYYEKAVLWAVENGITDGWTADSFAPDMTCTRGQIVTFLWRFEKMPLTTSTVNIFKDVKENSYYKAAVLWAVENGITDGWTADQFAPDMMCTRGQSVTFLYRYSQ